MKDRINRLLLVLMLLVSLTVLFTACGHKHTYGAWVVEKEPTCIEDGAKSRVCECNEKETEVIPAKGHTDGEWITDVEANCTETGSKHLTCAVCAANIKTETIPATGHTNGQWVTDTGATCTQNGSKHQECATCRATLKTETIPAKGHTDGQWITDLDATCTEKGSKHQECSACKASLKTETIPATGKHEYTWKITTEASCAGNGVKTFTCSGCNGTYTETIESKTYTATEIYENYVNSVGEIITYDKSGNEYAIGTGFVYSSDGKIITNYHVIEKAYSAKVYIAGGEYKVQYVLTYDKEIDIAILKISANNLKPVKLCERTHKVGSVVYALGSSKGLTATFSDGMITYADRVLDGVSYTQHDAPISGGNSGGPLINGYGEVIGINTWTVRESQNLNFAINVSELNNLYYGTPLTMAELYQKECDVFTLLKNYIIENGSYSASSNSYSLVFSTFYSPDYTSKYRRVAFYFVSSNTISLDFVIDDGDNWVYFEINNNVDGSYYWEYFDENDYVMSGTLYASSYTSSTLLGYSYNNISYSSLRTSIRELASTMINSLCSGIDAGFSSIGVTAEDLHFDNY